MTLTATGPPIGKEVKAAVPPPPALPSDATLPVNKVFKGTPSSLEFPLSLSSPSPQLPPPFPCLPRTTLKMLTERRRTVKRGKMKCARASHSEGARCLLWISRELRTITPDPPGRGLLRGDGCSQNFRLSHTWVYVCITVCHWGREGCQRGFYMGWHLKSSLISVPK